MKKSLSILLSLIFVFSVAFFVAPKTEQVFADGESEDTQTETPVEPPIDTSVQTSIVLPDGYEQLYELNYPVDVDYDGDDFLILEYNDVPSYTKLSIFRNGEYKAYSLPDLKATEARFFMGRILLLSSSDIFVFDETTGNTTVIPNIAVAKAFAVCANVVATGTSSDIKFYEAAEADGALNFTLNKQHSLGGTADSLVLTENGDVYFFYNNNINRYDAANDTHEIISEYSGVVRYSVSKGDGVYYSLKNGVWRFDTLNLQTERVNATEDSADVQGIAFHGEKLLAAYKGERAVKEIDLSAENGDGENFTDYAITARGDLNNRLSAQVTDFCYTNDTFFILDDKTLKVIKLGESNSYNSYDLSSFVSPSSEITAISAAGDTVMLVETLDAEQSKETKIRILSLTEQGLELNKTIEDYKSITSVTACEGEFYFLNNTLNMDTRYTEVNVIRSDGGTIETVCKTQGFGRKLAVDIFGEAIISLDLNEKTYLYSSTRGDLTEIADKASDIFTDLDGNVYYILGANIYRYGGDDPIKFDIDLWANAPEGATLKAFERVGETDTVYLMYNGFILECFGLGIKTPYKIAPPADYTLDLSTEYQIVTVAEGCKMFTVTPSLSESSKYFDCGGYVEKTGEDKFILISEFSNYALIADESKTYLIRRNEYDLAEKAELTKADYTAFITNDVHAYKVPLLKEDFISFDLSLNAEVSVISTCSFNDTDYALIKSGENSGYVPKAFLKSGVADSSGSINYEKSTVGKRGATVYADPELTVTVTELDYGDTVYVVEKTDGISKIVYGEGYAYVETASLSDRTYYAVRNLLVILLLFVAMFSSTVFVLKTRVFGRKKSD